jgi:protein TonB
MLLISIPFLFSDCSITKLQEWIKGINNDSTKEEYIESYTAFVNGGTTPTPIIDFDLKHFFPAAAKAANITKKSVIVLVKINEVGELKGAEIVSGKAGYGFDEAALKIINKARFSPGSMNGKPVKMSHRIPINFILDD